MAKLVTCDGCGDPISPNEREYLTARIDETTLAGTTHNTLDFHTRACLRRWIVDAENAAAQARAAAERLVV